jgi:AcrR family transcriptional regulator
MARAPQRPRQAIPSTGGRGGLPFLVGAASNSASAVAESIVSATEKLLGKMSFADMTVADILNEAGVSRTTFYRYFTSKEMVVAEFLKSHHPEYVDLMRPWFTRPADRPPEETLREAMHGSAVTWKRHRPMMRACSESWHTGQDLGTWYAATLTRYASDVSAQIDRERAAGHAPPGVDSHQLALGLVWGTERMFYLSSWGMFGAALEQDVIEPVVAIWFGAIYRQ